MKVQNVNTVRASISFAPDIYESLEELAKQKKVSLAWVVRDAAEKYVAEEKSFRPAPKRSRKALQVRTS